MTASLERLKPLLVCPECHGTLLWEEYETSCSACDAVYPIKKGKVYFVSPPPREDAVDSFKEKLRTLLGEYYYSVGIPLFSLSYVYPVKRVLERHPLPPGTTGLYAGSGNQSIGENFINADLTDYDNVDVVCDITRLPFADGCLDAVITKGVLEHLPQPRITADEFSRCTKSGGLGIHFTPFMYPFHASPHDYFRFTHMGIRALFDAETTTGPHPGEYAWTVEEQINTTGPFTLFPTLFAEYIAALAGMGHTSLTTPIYFLLCLLLFPLKFLDIFFVGNTRLMTLCTSMLTVLRRTSAETTPTTRKKELGGEVGKTSNFST